MPLKKSLLISLNHCLIISKNKISVPFSKFYIRRTLLKLSVKSIKETIYEDFLNNLIIFNNYNFYKKKIKLKFNDQILNFYNIDDF